MSKIDNSAFEGVNPFPEYCWHDDVQTLDFTLYWFKDLLIETRFKEGEHIVKGINFNPYITDNEGDKVYYQRELCWGLEEKQNLIESIYNQMNCGSVVIRLNDDKRMYECGYEYDIVDGKQRIHTLLEFFKNEFPDKNGYYWKDFSKFAQRHFLWMKPFSLFMFRENVADDKIKNAFLNVNFAGVPMSKEHIDFVKNINV